MAVIARRDFSLISFMSIFIPSLFFALLFSLNSINGKDETNSLYVFDTMYQFGDSISDTGNLIREGPLGASTPFSRFPYGDTYFNKPTGRCSNGLLMIDFIAKELGLPHLNPYLDKEADFQHGANFAVAGSTALDTSFWPRTELWFRSPTVHSVSSLIGSQTISNQSAPLSLGKTIDEVKADLVPKVVQTIKSAAEKIIDLGGVNLVIPGNFPIGCLPIYLTAFKTDDSEEHPDVLTVYADYYNAFKSVLDNATLHGFDKESVLKACCGSGGDYNFDLTKLCGFDGVPAPCPDPDKRLSWDGIHMTQKAHKFMAEYLVRSFKLDNSMIPSFAFVFVVVIVPFVANAHNCSFDAMYNFGDSLSDTGNLAQELFGGTQILQNAIMYKNSMSSSGRCSNGKLLIDFLAEDFNLPLLNPSLDKSKSFDKGANFAVAGATALTIETLNGMGIHSIATRSSLLSNLVGLKIFATCKEKFKNTLFVVGEIGGNDFNYAATSGSVEGELELTPIIIGAIKSAVQKVIDMGASKVLVPGQFATGCIPMSLATMQAYGMNSDENHCIKSYNVGAEGFNYLLKQALSDLRQSNPDAVIVYADYYKSMINVLNNAQKYGFDPQNILKACCGSGGLFNFDLSSFCGTPTSTVCSNPNQRLSWDGLHLSENTYKYMAEWILADIKPQLKCGA
ncbi:hypothetical protein Scep_018293 [Stephania cephalantha]|uniref:Uncharacterized protein n=1 Tax=Stephania cephalantha TaxID=152367 RepID=A0AAP0IRR5_9MAGN